MLLKSQIKVNLSHFEAFLDDYHLDAILKNIVKKTTVFSFKISIISKARLYLVDKLFGFVNKFIKEKGENHDDFSKENLIEITDKKPLEEKLFDDISNEKPPLILPKKIDFTINSFKLSLIIEENEKNGLKLKEKMVISRTFELKASELNLSLVFKKTVISSDIHIEILMKLLIKTLVFQTDEIGDLFDFSHFENIGLLSEYSRKDSAEKKISVISVKNTINVRFLSLIFLLYFRGF